MGYIDGNHLEKYFIALNFKINYNVISVFDKLIS